MYFFIVLSGLHFELTTLWQVTPNQRKLRDRIGSPGVVSSRVPHHPAYGSVQGGSN